MRVVFPVYYISRIMLVTILLWLIVFEAFSATDGKIGRTSTGSISISLTIPTTRQVHIAPTQQNLQPSRDSLLQYCVGVTDRSVKSASRDYHFTASRLSSTEEGSLYQVSRNKFEVVQLKEKFSLRLKNSARQHISAEEICALNNGNLLAFDKEHADGSHWLIELIPE